MTNAVTLDEVKAQIGKEIGVSDWVLIDQPRIDAFAAVTQDHQFIHVDPDRAARETPFGGAIAHGYLTLSLLSAFAYQAVPAIVGVRMGVNYGLNKVRFLSPVRAGARVRGRFTLRAVEERSARAIMSRYDVTVEVEGEDKPALIAEWLTMVFM
ncbi:MAG: MaoC family dehydratase [Pseudomonadota bacterium]